MTECMRKKSVSCSGKPMKISGELELNAVIFLLNGDSGTLLGPFTVAESPEDLEKGAWYSSIEEKRFSGNVKVEWENLHQLENALSKISFLNGMQNCELSPFQTQELLTELKSAPLYSESKA